MRVLLTNDDGSAPRACRPCAGRCSGSTGSSCTCRARLEPQRRPRAGSPPARRSGSRRSSFDDGTTGFATEGTPVDCVRFADLGLLGERPDLIVSGINHGSNLGDDVTYSGTVAAALEGIVLGIPAIAVSQQSARARWTSGSAASSTSRSRPRSRRPGRACSTRSRSRRGRCSTSTARAGSRGVEVTRLGKRLYDDELKQVEQRRDGRRRYQIYGFEPGFEDEQGTDLAAVARGASRSRRSTST